MSEAREKLVVGLYDTGVIRFSDFEWTLKSGRKSPFYFNIRPATSVDYQSSVSPARQIEIRDELVSAYSEAVDELGGDYEHLHGIAQAATVLGGLVAAQRGDSYVWERIGKKDYGAHAQFEGHARDGERIVTVDDVVTDGASKIETAKKLEASGFVVAGQVIGMDRGEGGIENVRAAGYEVGAVMTLNGAAATLLEAGRIGNQEVDWVAQYHQGLRDDGLL